MITVSIIWVYFDTSKAINDVNDARLEDLSESFLKVLVMTDPSVLGENQDMAPEDLLAQITSKTSPEDKLEQWSSEKLLKDDFAYLLLNQQGSVLANSANAPPVDLDLMRRPGLNDIKDHQKGNTWRGVTMVLTQPKSGELLWLWLGEDKQLRARLKTKSQCQPLFPCW